MCKYTVSELRKRLGDAELILRSYLQYHQQDLEPYAANVHDTFIRAINVGLDEAIRTLAVASVELWRQHHLVPPPPSGGATFEAPKFAELRKLVEANTNSLVVRSSLWTHASTHVAGAGGGERKVAPGPRRGNGPTAKGGADTGGRRPTFKLPLIAWDSPPASACAYTWSGKA